MVTQFTAAVLAGLLVNAIGGKQSAGATASVGKMLVVEFLFTFALAYIVLNVATAKGTEGNSFYGLAIGFVIVVGAISVGWISGAAFNPAIALGATVLGAFKWSTHLDIPARGFPRRRGRRRRLPVHTGRARQSACRSAQHRLGARYAVFVASWFRS